MEARLRSCARQLLLLFAVLAVGVCRSLPASAQTDEEFFQTFPLNFSNPGARAQAMGGAFIAIADDASAAVTNPAGLSNLTRQQAYFEYKGLDAPVAKLNTFGSLTNGVGPVDAPYEGFPGFINYARPISDKMTVAASYHQFLAYKNTFNLDARRVISLSAPLFPSVNATVDFKGMSFSGAVGYTVTPTLKVGGAVSFNRLDASVDAPRSSALNFSGAPFCGTGTTAADCPASVRAARIPGTEIHDKPSAIAYTAGALYQPVESLTLGVVAAIEPHFTMHESVKAGESYPGQTTGESWDVPFNLPSRFGSGVAWRLNDRALATFDIVYVRYSQLVENSQPVVFRHAESFNGFCTQGPTSPTSCSTVLATTAATVANGTDTHGGLEYLIVKAPTPIFIRYGFERLAPHIVTAGSCPIPFGANFNDPGVQQGIGVGCTYQSQLYAGVTQTVGQTESGDTSHTINLNSPEYGYSVGAGFVIGSRSQVDVAYVHTSYHRTDFIVSMAVRF
jgi:long-subunit fatty acid transport protein